jgi:nucleotide-binding universal stress UspA family protein
MPCQAVIVRGPFSGETPPTPFRRILVPTNGSRHADAAFEFAADYARRVDAGITMLFFVQSLEQNPLLPSLGSDQAEMRAHQVMLENLQERFQGSMRMQRAEVRVVEGASLITAISEEAHSGGYDLVALGAEEPQPVGARLLRPRRRGVPRAAGVHRRRRRADARPGTEGNLTLAQAFGISAVILLAGFAGRILFEKTRVPDIPSSSGSGWSWDPGSTSWTGPSSFPSPRTWACSPS